MTEPKKARKEGDEPAEERMKIEELELNTETLEDLTASEAEGAAGGLGVKIPTLDTCLCPSKPPVCVANR